MEKRRRYYYRHREKCLAKMAEYYRRTIEARRAYQAAYYQRNKHRRSKSNPAYMRQYRAENRLAIKLSECLGVSMAEARQYARQVAA